MNPGEHAATDSGFEDREFWKQFAKVGPVTGEQALKAGGKCPDEHISHRALCGLFGPAFLHMPRPSISRIFGILPGPGFPSLDAELEKKFLKRFILSVKIII